MSKLYPAADDEQGQFNLANAKIIPVPVILLVMTNNSWPMVSRCYREALAEAGIVSMEDFFYVKEILMKVYPQATERI